jgi:hypothetical protein
VGECTHVSISKHGQTYPCFDIQVQANVLYSNAGQRTRIAVFSEKKKKHPNAPTLPWDESPSETAP